MKILDDLYAFPWRNPAANNCNTYLLKRGKNVLVDPGHYPLFGRVRDELSRLSLSHEDMDLVLITHGHPDHLEGVEIFRDTKAVVAMYGAELDFISKIAPHYGPALSQLKPQVLLQEGNLTVGNLTLQIVHTPGHSPGGICIYWPERKVLFTGDLVFSGGIGRIDLPGGSGKDLKESIRKISMLEVDYLLPGHGEILSGQDLISENFRAIERDWFDYL
jgi:hydroxyacylglutathione hydrolase